MINKKKNEIEKEIEEMNKEIEKKKIEFFKNAKQCNFCGNYYGELDKQIDELIAQKEGFKEGFEKGTQTKEKELIEIELDKIIGIDKEERDDSVNYYQPFCIVGEQIGDMSQHSTRQIQISLDWERLIDLAKLLKPYLDSYEEQCKMDEELEMEDKKRRYEE